MTRKIVGFVAGFLVVGAVTAQAQVTLMPSYNAPYRAFEKHEFGGTLSFPGGSNTGIEGQYRLGYKSFDIGARGGVVTGNSNTTVILGIEGRVRVVAHTENFPLDGAIIFGVGTNEFDDFNFPIGLSLGRRIDLEDSNISITPYAQPTMFIVTGNGFGGTDNVGFGLGLGADFRLSSVFDVRASFGIGDVDGFSVSAVWVR